MIKIIKYSLSILLALLCIIFLTMIRFDIPPETLNARYANENSKFLEIDGMQVHYRDEGSGYPIVLVHGTSASLHTWDGWTAELSKKHRVIRMDIPAFGLTGPARDGDYTVTAYVQFLDAFLSKLELRSFHIAGNSLGGLIAWNYTLSHPQKVKKLILIDSAGYPSRNIPGIFRLVKIAPFAFIGRFITPRIFIEKNLREVYGDDKKITNQLIDRYYNMALRRGNRQAFIDRVRTPRDYEAFIGEIGKINVPTLIMWGRDDLWIPLEDAHRFNREIPGSRLVVYDGVGHVPMEEIPEKTADDAMVFLRSLKTGSCHLPSRTVFHLTTRSSHLRQERVRVTLKGD